MDGHWHPHYCALHQFKMRSGPGGEEGRDGLVDYDTWRWTRECMNSIYMIVHVCVCTFSGYVCMYKERLGNIFREL